MGKKSDERIGKKEKKTKKSERDKKAQKVKKSGHDKQEKKSGKRGEKSRKAARKAAAKSPRVSPEQRLDMIAKAAYYIAERHGFTPGMKETDWQAAERQIDDMLKNEG